MSGYSRKFDEWAQRPDTKAKLDSAKKNAWAQFTKQFPNADKDKFNVQTSVDENFKISAEVFSMKARTLQLAFLAQTESIGASK